jgi:hypothetical protein
MLVGSIHAGPGTVARVSAFIRGAGESVLPVIGKVGGCVDRVNGQLDKLDRAGT